MIPRMTPAEYMQRRAAALSLQLPDVTEIVSEVRRDGDAALVRLAAKYDGADLTAIGVEVARSEMEQAFTCADRNLLRSIEHAADNVRDYHSKQVGQSWECTSSDGARLGYRLEPIERVGIYVPGGTAPYPSTVVMTAVPAKVAGVREVIMCTPPGRSGAVNQLILAAAVLCGVSRVFRAGGAGAIAAMAYGAGCVPRVDKIVGPGNAFVTAAKRLVWGDVGIDMLAGPSEVLIIADSSANPALVAADLIAQAEHDPLASAVLVSISRSLADRVEAEISSQLPLRSRRAVIRESLSRWGAIVEVDSVEDAISLANQASAEHVQVMVDNPRQAASSIRSAGTVFVGEYTPTPIGDYMAGPNHVLPTMGSARHRGSLSAGDFLRPINTVECTVESLLVASADAIMLARAEGLDGHAASMEMRASAVQNAGRFGSVLRSAKAVSLMQQAQPAHRVQSVQQVISPIMVKLDANESPLDIPEALKADIVREITKMPFNRYPCADLEQDVANAFASEADVDADRVTLGAGSDEIIQMTMLALRPRIDHVTIMPPTFTMYRRIAEAVGLPVHEIPLSEGPSGGFGIDMDALERELRCDDALVFICNPNNPTGDLFTRGIREIVACARAYVVVDEAYHEFCGDTLITEVPGRSGRLMITRTLSKAFGLAGLRAGFAVAGPLMTQLLQSVRLPYNCSTLSLVAARQALARLDLKRSAVDLILKERAHVAAGLSELGLSHGALNANFLFVRCPVPGDEIRRRLMEREVLVRCIEDAPDFFRVTIGAPWENSTFLNALGAVLEEVEVR